MSARLFQKSDYNVSKLTTIVEDFDLLDHEALDDKPEPAKASSSKVKFLDTKPKVVEFLESIRVISSTTPYLYIDIEGIELSRHGNISILEVYVLPAGKTYLLDIYTLQEKAFSTLDSRETTLKRILESNEIKKVFFDVRNDSDALFAHYGIHLAGIHDLQSMELVTRSYSKKFVTGLGKGIETDAPITPTERLDWTRAKERGRELFAPECGGKYEVFNNRPLSQDILQYCCQDVEFLPTLWKTYDDKMTSKKRECVVKESIRRVNLSHMPNYDGKGRSRALAPFCFV
ncbi:exonuclease [Penicillium cosmopolitanum]|uniref:Exonuclease n=1 Tax=Penicillium cosmopolitanum TaxID=1131564 RepID=A0A9W9SK85_9EURO|nr:exonuclease [Penicillium cosmopolitanum]KAJ5379259.1 exonuclease [Penicillium cosmopolitanum]